MEKIEKEESKSDKTDEMSADAIWHDIEESLVESDDVSKKSQRCSACGQPLNAQKKSDSITTSFKWPYNKDMIQKSDYHTLKENRQLWDKNQDVDQVMDDNGWTALMFAVRYDDEEFVKYLLHKRANINKADSSECTALHVAIRHSHLTLAKRLVKYYGALNLPDITNITPIEKLDRMVKPTTFRTIRHNKEIAKIKAYIQKRDEPKLSLLSRVRSKISRE
jgi:hypothetical protein